MEVESSSFSQALFMLLCTHYTFDIDYKGSEKLFYIFFKGFCLGIVPSKKIQEVQNCSKGTV